MFHVKHFGKVEAQNLTSARTKAARRSIRSAQILVRNVDAGRGWALTFVAARPCAAQS